MAISVRDVAERAGVSVGTVSNVLNTPGKVAAVDDGAGPGSDRRGSGSCATTPARQLRAGSSREASACSCSNVGNPFFTDVARAQAERGGRRRPGLSVLLANSRPGRGAARERPSRPVREAAGARGAALPGRRQALRGSNGSAPRHPLGARRPGWRPHRGVFVGVRRRHRRRQDRGGPCCHGRRRLAFVGGPPTPAGADRSGEPGSRRRRRRCDARGMAVPTRSTVLEGLSDGRASSERPGRAARRRVRRERPRGGRDAAGVGILRRPPRSGGHRHRRLRRHRLRRGRRRADDVGAAAAGPDRRGGARAAARGVDGDEVRRRRCTGRSS